jgi:acetyl-CoA carboxylase biotin carboxyl carrier protein
MDVDGIRTILDLVKEHDLSEFELEVEGLKIKVRKSDGIRVVEAAAAGDHAPLPSAAVSSGGAAGGARAVAERVPGGPAAPVDADLAIVSSPIVGTLYRAPEPGAPPFVDIGARVKKGQVLCIIEAMKLMNEIECDYAGDVVSIYVENGQPVQYGERLFAIRLA